MKGYYQAVIKILRDHGFVFLRDGKGDHELWAKSLNILVVPYNLKNKNTANGILKQAGLAERV
jgi:predicted RNA binding protein YcfA (HicA-like mRNA interferase family)